MTIEEMEEAMSATLNLSDELRAISHGDGSRTQFEYELAWVRTYLKKAGALENSERGVWRLTTYGLSISDAEIATIPKRVREEDRQNRLKREIAEEIDDAEEIAETTWRDKLLQAVLSMPPAGFERLCQRILRESGFTKVEVTGKSGDGGIDGTGVLRLISCRFTSCFKANDLGVPSAPASSEIFGELWLVAPIKGWL